MATRPFIVLLLVASMSGCRGSARHPEIRASASCNECRIQVNTVWASQAGDDKFIATGWPLERTNELWLVGQELGHAIVQFPLNGDPTRVVDREGDGPGEFRFVVAGGDYASGDTIVLIGDARITYLTSDLQEVRRFRNGFPRPSGQLILQDGSVLLVRTALPEDHVSAGFAVHHVGPTGNLIGSFRPTLPHYSAGLWPLGQGLFPGTVWVVEPRPEGFMAELWNVNARQPLRTLRVEPDWWVEEKASPQAYERSVGSRPPTLVRGSGTVGVWETEEALWIALRHYDPYVTGDVPYGEVARWFDGVLVALDKTNGGILAAEVFDEFLYGFTAMGRIVMYHEDAKGRPRLRLAEVTLTRG